MFKFITHKSFFVNLLVIILVVLLLIFLFFSLLGVMTKHDETQKVPSVIGRNYNEAERLLKAAGLAVNIQDSIFTDTAGPLQVMRQSPDADAVVKAGRTIYLTINRAVPPQVEMPDLRGFSLKSAELFLQSLGLKMGELTYVPDIAKNAVKDQLINGNPLAPGTKINMGSSIDLLIGNGLGDQEIDVPDLIGMTVSEAQSYLSGNNIELGAVIAESPINDTATAYIISQKPDKYSDIAPGERIRNKIRAGQIMDVWISTTPPVIDTTTNNATPN